MPTVHADVHALIDAICGPPDDAANRTIEVLNAHAAALAWVRDTTGSYPAPVSVAARLAAAADRLRSGEDIRDPAVVLGQVAVDALAAYRTDTT